MIQPPLWQTADGFIVPTSPQTSPSFVWNRLSCHVQLGYQSALWAWPAQTRCLIPGSPICKGGHQSALLPCYINPTMLLSPQYLNKNSLQGSKPDTRCDEGSVVLPTAAAHFTLLISSYHISFVMNKSKSPANDAFAFDLSLFFFPRQQISCQR